MAMLVGQHVNKIDSKGRISVPKPFRANFQGASFSGLFVYPLFNQPALEACTEAYMERMIESLDSIDMFSEEQDDMAAVTVENTHQLAFDPEGRVVLPPELLEHAGIEAKAVFVGRGSRMRIWNPDMFRQASKASFESARARKATLSVRKPTGDGEG